MQHSHHFLPSKQQAFAAVQQTQAHELLLQDRAAARLRKQRAVEQIAANRAFAEERHKRKEGVVSQNEVGDAFFSKFGTSHR
jgi:hypothetical protein